MLPAGPEKAQAGRGRQQLAAGSQSVWASGCEGPAPGSVRFSPSHEGWGCCHAPSVPRLTPPCPEAAHDLQEAKVAPVGCTSSLSVTFVSLPPLSSYTFMCNLPSNARYAAGIASSTLSSLRWAWRKAVGAELGGAPSSPEQEPWVAPRLAQGGGARWRQTRGIHVRAQSRVQSAGA